MGLRILLRPSMPNPETGGKSLLRSGIVWIGHVLYIVYCLEVGLFLLVLPWLRIWENNYLLFRYPDFRGVVTNLYLKVAVFGLGLANIVIGVQEFVQIKKGPRTSFFK